MNGLSLSPFALRKTERQAIRDLAKVLFSGGNPGNDDELKEEWKKYSFFFDTALFCLDARYGNWLSSPMGVSPADMGIKSFEAYALIRDLFRDKLDKEMTSALNKARVR
jgi:hypothetical protein